MNDSDMTFRMSVMWGGGAAVFLVVDGDDASAILRYAVGLLRHAARTRIQLPLFLEIF